jgi:hypothetical protein
MCAKRKIPKFIMEDWDSWENVQLVLIEDFSCNSRNELRRKERGHIEKELNNPLCRNVPFIILKIKDYKKARRERLRSAILP